MTTPPEYIIVGCAEEIEQFRKQLSQLGADYVEGIAFRNFVVDLIVQLTNRHYREYMANSYASENGEMFENVYDGERMKFIFEEAVRSFASAMASKFDLIGLYNPQGLLDYTVGEFMGDDIVLYLIEDH